MVWWLFSKKEDSNRKVKDLHKSLERSFYHLKNDMSNVNEWILHFKDKHSKHENDFSEVFRRVKVMEQMMERLNDQIKKSNKNLDDEELEHSTTIERVQSFERSDASFMNVQSDHSIASLTPAQKQVLALLLQTGGPSEYEYIAKQLKLNIVTIRRYINDMKRLGVPIKEKVSVKNRRKMIYVDQKLISELREKRTKNSKKQKSE